VVASSTHRWVRASTIKGNLYGCDTLTQDWGVRHSVVWLAIAEKTELTIVQATAGALRDYPA
jgi:hypothetical protein